MTNVGIANVTECWPCPQVGNLRGMPVHHGQSGRIPDRVKERPTWLLNRAYARSSALLFAGFDAGGDGLRGYHYRLLAALEQWGPASQADDAGSGELASP